MAELVSKLIVVEGPEKGREVELGDALVTIGRAEQCTLLLTDSAVSRRHVTIERSAEGWVAIDAGSANGTFLEGEAGRISRHALQDGDQIRLGKTVIRVVLVVAAPASDAASERTQILGADEAARGVATSLADQPSRLRAQRPLERPIVLTVLLGPDRGMVYSPAGDVVVIGRMSSCDVPLNDAAVSRRHATIKRESAGYVLYDESTQNGTWLGDPEVQVYHAPLEDGDVFRVGETRIRLDLGGVASHVDDHTQISGKFGDRTFTMRVKGLSARARAAAPAVGAEVERTGAAASDEGIVLVVKAGADAGKRFEVGKSRVVIGRSGDCDVRFEDGQISSHHCSVTIAGDGFVVRDEGSRNGTFVRGGPDKISEARVVSGEMIRVGSTDFQVERRAPVERTEIATSAAVAVPPVPPGGSEATPPVAPSPVDAAARAKVKVEVPELARSAEAKQRISRIMKGVSLRPARRPGTPRQWASLAAVFFAGLVSLGLAWRWPSLLAAGPLHEGHAELDTGERCGTCHLDAGWSGTPHREMSRGCASQDCHGDVLLVRRGVVDDCLSCHTEHRGRSFDIRGGEEQCWSCHIGAEEPRDFATRPMRAAVVTAPVEREPLLAKVTSVDVGLRFSHLAHDAETKGDERFDGCVGCHADVDSGRTFALPSHAQCMECHAESAVSADVEVAKKSPGPKCLECHAREDGSMQRTPKRPFEYVQFAHRDHQNEFCKSCHADIWDVKSYEPVVRSDLYPISMDACYTCHEQKQATIACLDCHREHHSFPPEEAAVAGAARAATALPSALAGLVVLSLFGFGYVYTDMVLVRRWLREPTPPPAAASGGAAAPAAEAPKGEIMPFPTVDVEACISCSSCYNSCPKQVLAGDDHGKSTVVNKDACIALEGCAVCEQGCPTGAIRVSTAPLVRTVERPDTDDHLEAKAIPGLFFIGEVVGAALIKSAVNQGTDVVRRIAEKTRKVEGADYDVVIIGAGPAGLGAGLEAKSLGLRYLLLERDTIASTIRAYPRDKAVLAEPIKVPLYGKLPMVDAEKDELIAVWEAVVTSTKLEVREHEEVTNVGRDGDKLVVETGKAKYTAANVVLAIGTRGNPRRLGCPGEDASCVSYLLIDAGEWKGKSVIVVGGGDSAIEAAVALAKAEGCTARLSYRKDKFSRIKKRNLEQVEEMAKAGRLELLFESTIEKVSAGEVVIKTKSGTQTVAAVHVFALIGADPPRGWIEKIGVPFVEREEAVVAWS